MDGSKTTIMQKTEPKPNEKDTINKIQGILIIVNIN